MGVYKLWDILDSCRKTLPLQQLQNKRVCIDLSCWIIQLHRASRSCHINGDKSFLRGLFHRFRALIALNCRLILVTDGSIPALKVSTYRKRLGSTGDSIQDETILERKSSLRRNVGSEFSRMMKEAKELGISLGIPCLDGIEEAEAQCAMLNSEHLCDGCFTADSDAFLFGARTVYRDIYLGEGGYVICYEMEDIEKKLGYGRNSLIALGLLLGGDYSQKVHGIGQESACQLVRSIGEQLILRKITFEGLDFARKKDKKNSTKSSLPTVTAENEQNHLKSSLDSIESQQMIERLWDVINAYLRPKCHSKDSGEVERVLEKQPFHHGQLQKICAEAFGWLPDQTDEYILPKFAERDLRRLANLRAISLDIGIQVPIPKSPTSYHVDSILKHRRVNGVECFMVSWKGDPRVEPSVVPADLLKSAYPEIVSEFTKRPTKKQVQRKGKPKESEDENLMQKVARQLDSLELGMDCRGLEKNNAEIHVIDLSSPSPIPSQKQFSCKSNLQPIDVIDISESDDDDESEYERRARELRACLARIKEDVSR